MIDLATRINRSTSYGEYEVIPADYSKELLLAPRHRNNPLIAALPLCGIAPKQLTALFDRRPPVPGKDILNLPSLERIAELETLKDIVYNLPQYQRSAQSFVVAVRETYVARNPVTAEDRRRRMLLHTGAAFKDLKLSIPAPTNWRSTATSLGFLGSTGSGKTTFARTIVLPFCFVIRHTSYRGMALVLDQIPLIYLQIPHDATVRSLCLEFFEAIDKALGYTDYLRQAQAAGGIAEMVILIARVATAVSLAAVFIDELQNLRVAKGPNIVIVLNLFSRLVEKAGVSVFTAGTPSVRDLMTAGTANQRKLVLAGEVNFPLMEWQSPELDDFMDVFWGYHYVKSPGPLIPSIRQAWYLAGAGNPAFMVLAYALAQRNEIGGREVVDETAFELAAKRHMATLQPAIRAMRIGNAAAMRSLDGMGVPKKLDALRSELGLPSLSAMAYQDAEGEDFPECGDDAGKPAKPAKPAKKSGSNKAVGVEDNLPTFEDPLNIS